MPQDQKSTQNELSKSNQTKEEMIQFILNSINPECKEIGEGYFNCIENKIKGFNSKSDMRDIEQKLNDTIIPSCMSNFNLFECLEQNKKL
jgi:hypothetical protein